MKRFLKLMCKCFVVSICAVSLCISALAYDPRKAIDYAKGHWNDGKGLCAEFASDCLIAGDMRFSADTDKARRIVDSPRGKIYRVCWGLFNDLQARRDIAIYDLHTDGSGRVPWSGNEGKVKPGDILFVKDLHPDDVTDTYTHAIIVGDKVNSTYVTIYGHNSAQNNEVLYVGRGNGCTCAHFK